jgi:hypothetical protein
MILDESEMNLRGREQSSRKDMLKAWLEMDEVIKCSMEVLDETSLLVRLSKAERVGEKREHLLVDMLEAWASMQC